MTNGISTSRMPNKKIFCPMSKNRHSDIIILNQWQNNGNLKVHMTTGGLSISQVAKF